MTTTLIKIAALAFMTIDHIGAYIPNAPIWLRWIGRLSSPLFFFCAAKSIVHTRDRKAYLKRLWTASIAMVLIESILPAFLKIYFGINIHGFDNNIFLTIFQGTLIASIIESTKNDGALRKKYLLRYAGWQCVCFIVYLLSDIYDLFALIGIDTDLIPILDSLDRIILTAAGSVWNMEGSIILMLQIIIFYSCGEDKKKLAIRYTAFCTGYFLVFVFQLGIKFQKALASLGLSENAAAIAMLPLRALGIPTMVYESADGFAASLFTVNYQWMMIFSLPIMLLYNGKKGKGLKKLFYVYYPVHLAVLYIIAAVF